MSRLYTVNSRKFDGSLRRSWECQFVSWDDEKIDLVGKFAERVEHPELGIIEVGTVSRERFYFSRWFNYFIFEQPAGTLRNYYINICMPPEVGGSSIDYIDLDIDLLIWPDGQWQRLDLEEFESNRLEFDYPDVITDQALKTLKDLEDQVEKGLADGIQALDSLNRIQKD